MHTAAEDTDISLVCQRAAWPTGNMRIIWKKWCSWAKANENLFLCHGSECHMTDNSCWIKFGGNKLQLQSISTPVVFPLHSTRCWFPGYGLVYARRWQSRYSPLVTNILCSRTSSTVTCAHCSNCVYNGEILDWMVVLTRACAQWVTLMPPPL